MTNKFDCVYYLYDNGEEIPYCRRLETRQQLNRNKQKCENQGVKLFFRDLLNQSIEPNEVLRWSSSIEMVDLYATIFYNRTLIEIDNNRFVCNCTKRGSFGKYCEYQLTHHAESFSEAIEAQFKQKREGDPWNTQRYGKILSYETLPCSTVALCLDWREICDGVQQCSSGTDEENWDKLEFNECEDDEFRCTNGMCIPQEFWLDGDFDCMDWSDELYIDLANLCPFNPNALQCDKHVCFKMEYSCGDGQCIRWNDRVAFQRFEPAGNECFSKRHLNYMCESSPNRRAWTLGNGLCWPDEGYDDPRYPSWHMMNSSTLTEYQKCDYLFRCILSNGLENDCPCNLHNCPEIMMSVCHQFGYIVVYPPLGTTSAHVVFIFDIRRYMVDPNVHDVWIGGNIQCRGFQLISEPYKFLRINPPYMGIQCPYINEFLCPSENVEWIWKDNLSPFQRDKFCWNESRTFNGRPYAVHPEACLLTKQCISQYRIHDGATDCINGYDELIAFERSFCTGNTGLHRFQCYNDQHKCLLLSHMGTGTSECSNSYDEMWYGGGGRSLQQSSVCRKGHTTDCHRIKQYITQSSIISTQINNSRVDIQEQEQISTKQIPFQFYCDSFWDRNDHGDELPSSCQHWICSKDQFRCRTGQCIYINWVCDGVWDCSDASDEEAIVLMQPWIDHNARLLKQALDNRLKQCQILYSRSPFSNICNTSFQFGCYLSGVSNPLDIRLNRPRINLTQIGDHIEDCYNAYDEMNTLADKSTRAGMWGWNFRCGK